MAQSLNVLPQLTRRPWQHCASGWLDSARRYCSVSGQDYYADQGSESDEKLRLLASMAQAAPASVEPLTRADRLPGC